MHRAAASTVVLGAFFLSACATVGRPFERPRPGELVLHRTTRADLERRFGAPASTCACVIGGAPVTELRWAYGAQTDVHTVLRQRVLTVDLVDDRLVAYSYATSFPAEQPALDAARAGQIVRGKTTRAEVLALFGAPLGEADPPVAVAGKNVVSYAVHRRTTNAASTVDEELVVTFDGAGVVADVFLDVSGKDAPPALRRVSQR
jgi:hypothetical protein